MIVCSNNYPMELQAVTGVSKQLLHELSSCNTFQCAAQNKMCSICKFFCRCESFAWDPGTPMTGRSTSNEAPPMKPHNGFALGPPSPACMLNRNRTADGINALRVTHDGEIGASCSIMIHYVALTPPISLSHLLEAWVTVVEDNFHSFFRFI